MGAYHRQKRQASPGSSRRASLTPSGKLRGGQGATLESGPSNVSIRAPGPLLPEVRVPQGVGDAPDGRRVRDQPLRAEAPERGIAPEVFLETLHLSAVIPGQLDGHAARHAVLGAGVHLPLRFGGPERRVDVQKTEDGL